MLEAHLCFHFAAFRAKFAFFFIAGEAFGFASTSRASCCTDLPAFFAAAVNDPRVLFFKGLIGFTATSRPPERS